MKTTDSVMREFDEKISLFYKGDDGFVKTDTSGEYTDWDNVKSFFSHSLAEARREVDEKWNKRLLKLEDKIFYTSTSKEALQAVKDMRASLTGDNPERKEV